MSNMYIKARPINSYSDREPNLEEVFLEVGDISKSYISENSGDYMVLVETSSDNPHLAYVVYKTSEHRISNRDASRAAQLALSLLRSYTSDEAHIVNIAAAVQTLNDFENKVDPRYVKKLKAFRINSQNSISKSIDLLDFPEDLKDFSIFNIAGNKWIVKLERKDGPLIRRYSVFSSHPKPRNDYPEQKRQAEVALYILQNQFPITDTVLNIEALVGFNIRNNLHEINKLFE